MKWIYPLSLVAGMAVVGAVLLLTGTGCDEIKAPCEIEETQTGSFTIGESNLESWKVENGFATLRYIYPEKTVFSICTARTIACMLFQISIPLLNSRLITAYFTDYMIFKIPLKNITMQRISVFLVILMIGSSLPAQDKTTSGKPAHGKVLDPGNTITASSKGSVNTSIYWFELPMAFTFNFGRPNRLQIGYGNLIPYSGESLLLAQTGTKTERTFTPAFTLTYFLNK